MLTYTSYTELRLHDVVDALVMELCGGLARIASNAWMAVAYSVHPLSVGPATLGLLTAALSDMH